MNLHSIPTAGNDIVLIALLAAVGLTLGIASGFATHVRAGEDGLAAARVGWLAATLLIAGIGSRMVFAFAVSHGLRSDLASSSIAHHISAAAWPTVLVLMTICEQACFGPRLLDLRLNLATPTMKTPLCCLNFVSASLSILCRQILLSKPGRRFPGLACRLPVWA